MTLRFAVCLSLILCTLILPLHARAQNDNAPSESIAAIVNNDAITMSDVAARMRLIMASSGMPNTDEMKNKIRPQIINMLIEERLIMQEAGKQGVTVNDDDVRKGFEALAAQNKFTPDQFRQVLAHSGIPPDALNSQIRSQIAWTKIIQKKIRPQIEITDPQIDAALKRVQAAQGQPEYLIAEIVLPIDNPAQENDVKQFADRLTAELSAGKAPFSAVASQFSQSATASKGGDMGWVGESQLPQEVASVVKQMKEGELSQPVRTLTGYHIILLRKARQMTPETMPSRDDVRQQVGMSQLDRMQRRYLLDLKSSAFIEHRV